MKYHFEHDFTHARMLVITLDKGDVNGSLNLTPLGIHSAIRI